jgi:hypothetical protein
MKKNKALLDKTEHALHQHSMITILIGRFVGPTRPLVPMVAGMLDLPVAKFILPNIIGCLLWPPLYFLPGILAGAAIDIPTNEHSASFKWLLLAAALLVWLAGWLCWRLWRSAKMRDRLTRLLPRASAVADAGDGGAGRRSANPGDSPSSDARLSRYSAQGYRALMPNR